MNPSRQFISNMLEHLSMPAVYVGLRKIFDNQQASIADYVTIIEKDSMLSQRIINIANNPFFGFIRKANTLHQAISLIGVMQLHDLMICCLCIRSLSAIPNQIFNSHAFWRHSISYGIATKIISQHSQIDTSNQFFTLGILHEIGHAAMFVKEPEISAKIFESHLENNISIVVLEKELLGLDYTQLGAEMMRFWSLPKLYQEVASHHLQPQCASTLYRPAVEIVNLAHAICQNLDDASNNELILKSRINNIMFSHLPTNLYEIITDNITLHADSILSCLLPKPILSNDINESLYING